MPKLRITDVEVFSAGTSWRNLTMVRVSTDVGIHGWGEATVEYREHAVAAHLEFLREIVVGLDPLASGALWARVVDSDWFRGDIVGLAAAAGLTTACLDIAGKVFEVPLFHLLGGPVRQRVPVYANGWYRSERTPDAFHDLALRVCDAGHCALKVDPFGSAGIHSTSRDISEADDLVAAIRDAVGPDIEIYIDAHGRFTPALAREAARTLAAHRIGYLEEPVAPDNLDAMHSLRATSDVPIAAGERCLGRWGFRQMIERDAVDVIQPDISWCGGLIEVQKIAAWAELHQMVVSLHNANSPFATMVGCHLGAALPNFMVLESFDDFDDEWVASAFPGMLRVDEGSLALPDRPGVGIEPDLGVLLEHPARPVFLDLNEPGWELRQGVIGR